MSHSLTPSPADDAFVLTRSPAPRSDAIARDRIIQPLRAARPGGLTVVAAPAGWGKTTAVSQWAWSRTEPTIWVDCMRTPQDPTEFWRAIRSALLRALAPEGRDGPRSMLAIDRPRMAHALGPLASASVPIALVFDDFHHLTDELRDDITALTAQLPPSLTLVLVTRADPLVALHRARVSGGVVEVRAADLAFTPYETHRLLEAHGLTLSSHDVDRLCSRTEGWVAGIRLALSAFGREPGSTAIVDAVVRASPSVAGYLIEQVLDRLDPADRSLLSKLSVIDRFDLALAEHLTSSAVPRSRLESLASVGGFLTEDITERFPFRIHGMLRTVLREELRGTDRATYRLLNARTAGWYRSANVIDSAVECALEAHEWDLAADLLIDVATLGIASGRSAWVARHLERFSATWESIDPRIVLVDVLLSLSRGDAAGSAVRLTMIEDAMRSLTGTSQVRADRLKRLLSAWVQQYRGDPRQVLAALGPDDDYVANHRPLSTPADEARRALAQAHRAYAQFSLGQVPSAERTVVSSMQMGQDRYEVIGVVGRQLMAAVAAARGDIREALTRSRDTLRLAAECGPEFTFDDSMAHAVAAWALLEQGDLAGAETELDQSQRAGPARHFSPPIGYLTDGVRARLLAATGAHPSEVLETIRDATERRPSAQYPYLFRIVRLATTVHALLAMGQHRAALDVIDSGPICERSANARLARATVLARTAIYDPSAVGPAERDEVREQIDALGDPSPETTYSGWSVRLLLAAAIAEFQADDVDRSTRLLHRALDETDRNGWRLPYLELGNSVVPLLSRERLRISTYNALIAELLKEIRPRTDDDPAELVVALSKREIEILRVLPAGYDQDELARRLFISKNTLKTHLRAIYRKLGVESRRQAVIKGERLRLL